MSFQTGNISFRLFKPSRDFEATNVLAEKLNTAALPPLNTLCEEQVHGWCGHRHAQDRAMAVENIALGWIPFFQLVQASRKVPASLLQSECAMHEQAVMKASDVEFLSAQIRSEIRQQVKGTLALDQPPTLKAIEVVAPRGPMVYSSATSETQQDALVLSLMQTTGMILKPMDPENLARELKDVDIYSFPPKSFSHEIPDVQTDITAGREFLMWLWYCSEKRGGVINAPDVGEVAFMIEGPLDFVMEGRGAHETILKRGNPMMAAEAKAAMISGKSLKSARVTFARGEEVWSFTLDADQFAFKGVKIPQTESFDRVGKFQERIVLLETFRMIFFSLYRSYLEERTETWDEVSNQIKQWVAERPAS